MKKSLRILCLVLLWLTLFSLASCGSGADDAKALANYLQYFDEPGSVPIHAYEKAEFMEAVYYYLDRGACEPDDPESVKLIIVYDKKQKTYTNYFVVDMEYGLHTEFLTRWEGRQYNAKSITVFSEEEIRSIVEKAAEYCK